MRSRPYVLSACIGAMASAAAADCRPDYQPLFYCEFPERNATVELCRRYGGDVPDKLHYVYRTGGVAELDFVTADFTGFARDDIQGIHGSAYGTAASHNGTYYGFMIDQNLMFFPETTDQGMPSSTPAVIEVYSSLDDLLGVTGAEPIARRVCDPATIDVDNANFGPG